MRRLWLTAAWVVALAVGAAAGPLFTGNLAPDLGDYSFSVVASADAFDLLGIDDLGNIYALSYADVGQVEVFPLVGSPYALTGPLGAVTGFHSHVQDPPTSLIAFDGRTVDLFAVNDDLAFSAASGVTEDIYRGQPPPPVPEPTSLALFGTALLALGFYGLRRRRGASR